MKPQATAHREGVYGWYPPSHNIYTKPAYKQLSGYDKECLYKHWYSAYAGIPGAQVPPPPGIGYTEAKDGSRAGSKASQRSRIGTRGSFRSDRKASPTRLKYLTSSGSVRPTSKSVVISPSGAVKEAWQKEAAFTSQKTLEYAKPRTPMIRYPQPDISHYGWSFDTPVIPHTPPTPLSNVGESPSVEIKPPFTPPSPPRRSPSPTRAKSATHSQPRSATSSRRSIKSAGSVRPRMTPAATEVFTQEQVVEDTQAIPSPPRPSKTPSAQAEDVGPCIGSPPRPPTVARPISPPKSVTPEYQAKSSRPSTVDPTMSPPVPPASPTPQSPAASLRQRIKSAPAGSKQSSRPSRPGAPTPSKCAPVSRDDSDAGMSYEELLDKYGWRMQVHGDPLNLKKSIIEERLDFTVKVPEPQPLPDPPKVHIEIWDTFFSNTIPRKPMSFTIHPDFVSETLHAKRMELQKREGGINYRYKNFSFAY